MTNVSVTNIFRGFCYLLSITTCFELELQNTTDLITAMWGLLNQLNGMGLLSSGYWILWTGLSTEKQLFANHKVPFFAWAISLSWIFLSIFKTLDCRVGQLDSFERSSSPGPLWTGRGPC